MVLIMEDMDIDFSYDDFYEPELADEIDLPKDAFYMALRNALSQLDAQAAISSTF